MSFFATPSILDDLTHLLIILGLVGALSLVFFPADRRLAKRSLIMLFAVVVGGGAALAWWSGKLRVADRDMTPAQLAVLSKAISQFPDVRFWLLTSPTDSEADALARKIVEAVKAGSGTMPPFDQDIAEPLKGVVLGVRSRDSGAGRAADAIGRAFMAAHIATMSDLVPDLDDNTMRIVVGRKP